MMRTVKNLPETVEQLRYQARKLELKISKSGDRFVILEYSPVGNFWVPIEECWGSLSHPLFFEDASRIVRDYV